MKVNPEELRQYYEVAVVPSQSKATNHQEDNIEDNSEVVNMFKIVPSPARHNVIRCGRNVSYRPVFPKDIYNLYKSEKGKKLQIHSLDSRACEYVDRVLGSETLSDFKRNCKNIPAMLPENPLLSNQVDFLEEIFIAGTKIYASHLQFTHSEAVLKDLFVDPFLKAAFSLTGAEKYPDFNVGFYPGEEALLSTTKKLKLKGEHVDNRFSYHADGILRAHNYGDIEICVVEVSGAFKKMT
ncbi:hypothetical protein G6F43_001685 [Rhizopus delemar]|nr:hypothetical protein G6F43_001685 [Rhizopus delemar]